MAFGGLYLNECYIKLADETPVSSLDLALDFTITAGRDSWGKITWAQGSFYVALYVERPVAPDDKRNWQNLGSWSIKLRSSPMLDLNENVPPFSRLSPAGRAVYGASFEGQRCRISEKTYRLGQVLWPGRYRLSLDLFWKIDKRERHFRSDTFPRDDRNVMRFPFQILKGTDLPAVNIRPDRSGVWSQVDIPDRTIPGREKHVFRIGETNLANVPVVRSTTLGAGGQNIDAHFVDTDKGRWPCRIDYGSCPLISLRLNMSWIMERSPTPLAPTALAQKLAREISHLVRDIKETEWDANICAPVFTRYLMSDHEKQHESSEDSLQLARVARSSAMQAFSDLDPGAALDAAEPSITDGIPLALTRDPNNLMAYAAGAHILIKILAAVDPEKEREKYEKYTALALDLILNLFGRLSVLEQVVKRGEESVYMTAARTAIAFYYAKEVLDDLRAAIDAFGLDNSLSLLFPNVEKVAGSFG